MTFELKDNDLENITGGTIIPYLIEAGDTLGTIANKFNCTVTSLISSEVIFLNFNLESLYINFI